MKTIRIKDYYGIYQDIPVEDHVYAEWQEMQKEENRRHKYVTYHSFSMDPTDMEELQFATGVDDLIDNLIRQEENRRLYESIAKLTPIQRRRIQMFMDDMPYSDIARAEEKDVSVIHRSLAKSFQHLRKLMSE